MNLDYRGQLLKADRQVSGLQAQLTLLRQRNGQLEAETGEYRRLLLGQPLEDVRTQTLEALAKKVALLEARLEEATSEGETARARHEEERGFLDKELELYRQGATKEARD